MEGKTYTAAGNEVILFGFNSADCIIVFSSTRMNGNIFIFQD